MKHIYMKINVTGSTLTEWHNGVFQHRVTEINLVQEKLNAIMRDPYARSQ